MTDSWQYAAPFIMPISVGKASIDVLGHVNNTEYVNWSQDAAWAHSKALGIDVADYPRMDRAMVIREARYTYLAAAFEDDHLEVGTWLTASDGRLLMTREFEIRRIRDNARLFTGRWELVCVRVSDGKPVRMPSEFLACYEPAVLR